MQVRQSLPGCYPLGLSSDVKSIQFIKKCINDHEVNLYKMKIILLQEMITPFIVKLEKAIRYQSTILFTYQYHPYSFELYLNNISTIFDGYSTYERRNINNKLQTMLKTVINLLTHFQIREQLSIANIFAIIDDKQQLMFKYFLNPDTEFLALQLPLKHDPNVRQIIYNNREQLKKFYDMEKNKLEQQIEEILSKNLRNKKDRLYFGSPRSLKQESTLFKSDNGQLPSNPHNESHSSDKNKKMDQSFLKQKNRRLNIKNMYESRMNKIKQTLKNFEVKKQELELKLKQNTKKRKNTYECQDHNLSLKEVKRSRIDEEKASQIGYNYGQQARQNKMSDPTSPTTTSSTNQRKALESKGQKYKMTIITSHDVEVQKVKEYNYQNEISEFKLIKMQEHHQNHQNLIVPKKLDEMTNEQLMLICNSAIQDHLDNFDPFQTATLKKRHNQSENTTKGHNKTILKSESDQIDHLAYLKKKEYMTSSAKQKNGQDYLDKIREAKWKAERLLKGLLPKK